MNNKTKFLLSCLIFSIIGITSISYTKTPDQHKHPITVYEEYGDTWT